MYEKQLWLTAEAQICLMASINQLLFPPQQQQSNWNQVLLFRFTYPNFMYREKYFTKKLQLQLPVLCTACLGDMNWPDTHTIGENPTAAERHRESAAFLSLKSCFGGLNGTRQPRVSVWWLRGINRGSSIRYTAPTQNRSAAAANCSRLCSQLVQQSVANVIRSLRTKAAFGKQRLT